VVLFRVGIPVCSQHTRLVLWGTMYLCITAQVNARLRSKI
jgi:hypothetical protein